VKLIRNKVCCNLLNLVLFLNKEDLGAKSPKGD
jgi:hypothetical protein